MNVLFLFPLLFAYANSRNNTFCMSRFITCYEAYVMNPPMASCEELKLIWNCIDYPESSCQKEYEVRNLVLAYCVNSDCGDDIDWCMADNKSKVLCLTDYNIVIIVLTVITLGVVIVLFIFIYNDKQKKKFDSKLKEITETTRLYQPI